MYVQPIWPLLLLLVVAHCCWCLLPAYLPVQVASKSVLLHGAWTKLGKAVGHTWTGKQQQWLNFANCIPSTCLSRVKAAVLCRSLHALLAPPLMHVGLLAACSCLTCHTVNSTRAALARSCSLLTSTDGLALIKLSIWAHIQHLIAAGLLPAAHSTTKQVHLQRQQSGVP